MKWFFPLKWETLKPQKKEKWQIENWNYTFIGKIRFFFCFDSKWFLYLKQLAWRKNTEKIVVTEQTGLILKMQGRELGIYLNYVTKPSVELTRFSGARQSPNSLQTLAPCIEPQKFPKPRRWCAKLSVSLPWPVDVLRSLQWQKPRLWLIKSLTGARILQQELCSLILLAPSTWNRKVVISQRSWVPSSHGAPLSVAF